MEQILEKLVDQGLEMRKTTRGAEYLDKNLAAADEFTRPFQEAMTAWCWGFGWSDDALDSNTIKPVSFSGQGLGLKYRLHLKRRSSSVNLHPLTWSISYA